MECKLCNIAENKQILDMIKLYQDDYCIAVLSKKPASMAHVIVYPKTHAIIIEQVPDEVIRHLFYVCNKISRAMFESLNIQGTNIYVQNGTPAGQEEPHFSIHIIARTENDGIKLDWEPRQLSEEEMSTIELQYKQFTEGAVFEEEKTAVDLQEETNQEESEDDDSEEENYMLKYFDKKP